MTGTSSHVPFSVSRDETRAIITGLDGLLGGDFSPEEFLARVGKPFAQAWDLVRRLEEKQRDTSPVIDLTLFFFPEELRLMARGVEVALAEFGDNEFVARSGVGVTVADGLIARLSNEVLDE